jgi:dipeptidyl aminopeptidase/acylaminoacyl peptidase
MKKYIILGAIVIVILVLRFAHNGLSHAVNPIMTQEKLSAENPVISPDGKRIIFVYRNNKANNVAKFCLTDVKGEEVKEIIPQKATGYKWSPDGARILYILGKKINVYNIADDSNLEIGEGAMAEWSPDGGKIAYLGNVERPIGNDPDTIEQLYRGWKSGDPTITSINIPTLMIYDCQNDYILEIGEYKSSVKGNVLSWLDNSNLIIIKDSTDGKFQGWNIARLNVLDNSDSTLMFVKKDMDKMTMHSISPDARHALIKRGDSYWVAEISTNAIVRAIDEKATHISWGDNGGMLFYCLEGNKIYFYNVARRKTGFLNKVRDQLLSPVSLSSGILGFSATSPEQNPQDDGFIRRGAIFIAKF